MLHSVLSAKWCICKMAKELFWNSSEPSSLVTFNSGEWRMQEYHFVYNFTFDTKNIYSPCYISTPNLRILVKIKYPLKRIAENILQTSKSWVPKIFCTMMVEYSKGRHTDISKVKNVLLLFAFSIKLSKSE